MLRRLFFAFINIGLFAVAVCSTLNLFIISYAQCPSVLFVLRVVRVIFVEFHELGLLVQACYGDRSCNQMAVSNITGRGGRYLGFLWYSTLNVNNKMSKFLTIWMVVFILASENRLEEYWNVRSYAQLFSDHDGCFFRLAISGVTANHTVSCGKSSNSRNEAWKEGSPLGWSGKDRYGGSCLGTGLNFFFFLKIE